MNLLLAVRDRLGNLIIISHLILLFPRNIAFLKPLHHHHYSVVSFHFLFNSIVVKSATIISFSYNIMM